MTADPFGPTKTYVLFRVLAWATGVMLILLIFVAMPLKYLADEEAVSQAIGMIHGIGLYPAYVVVAFALGYQRRWSLTRMLVIILAGTVPFMSFVAERRVTAETHRTPSQDPAGSPAPPA